jgi:hypothetical protein
MIRPYEIRIDGCIHASFASLEKALDYARRAVARDPDLDPEIMDARTGRACMVAGSKRWRDEIAEKLGA